MASATQNTMSDTTRVPSFDDAREKFETFNRINSDLESIQFHELSLLLLMHKNAILSVRSSSNKLPAKTELAREPSKATKMNLNQRFETRVEKENKKNGFIPFRTNSVDEIERALSTVGRFCCSFHIMYYGSSCILHHSFLCPTTLRNCLEME